jgi:transcription antitermination factor NusG
MQNIPWHVLHVLSNHENRVAQHLAVRSVEHYIPLYKERVKWTDRTKVTERPLFSGYVFARISAQNRIAAVSTPGVLRVLGDDLRDMVSEEELGKIRQGLTGGLLLQPHPQVPVGTRVRILAGVFTGVEGVVLEMRKQCRVVLSLAAVRQSFSLEIGIDELLILDRSTVEPGMRIVPAYSR